MVFFILYVSSATQLLDEPALDALLKKSRANNEVADISGLLLYKDGNFIQIMEGEEKQVRELYSRVQCDPRHRGIITLLSGFTQERLFPDWRMGFRDLNRQTDQDTPGFSEFMNAPFNAETFQNEGKCWRMLGLFRQNM